MGYRYALVSFLLLWSVPAAVHAAVAGSTLASCAVQTPSLSVPAGYGVPYDVFSSAKTLLVDAACSGTEVRLFAGDRSVEPPRDDQYVYRKAYAYRSGAWSPYTVQGLPGSSEMTDWVRGAGEAEMNITATEITDGVYVVAYVCTWRTDEWRCGCENAACDSGMWQMQIARREAGQSIGRAGINAAATRTYLDAFENEIFRLLNNERTSRGLTALGHDVELDELARLHSGDMADRDFFSHTNPDGCDAVCRYEAAGYLYTAMGENIAFEMNNAGIDALVGAQNVITGWLDSPGHRDIMLSINYSNVGIGVSFTGHTAYATADFSKPR